MSLPQEIKDSLLEHFGQDHLPQNLQTTLESNPEARAFWDELHNLDQTMPGDGAFYPDEQSFDDLIERVESEIDATVERKHLDSLTRPWYRAATIAASVALMAVAVMLALQMQDPTTDTAMLTTTETETVDDTTALIQPNESTTSALISEFASRQNVEASEWLLEDLTDEEFEYLQENFQVGDLL
ncbi:hypothetical protein GF356_12750 [candidate division GN15 bacterium]|nr:hypothetical protein [candidate division GN15 bacterium]